MPTPPWKKRLIGGVGALALLAVTQFVPTDAAPQATAPLAGRALGQSFAITCTPTKTGTFDPIVMPGHTGMSHLHQFFGNRGITQDSTASSLRRGGGTTCSDSNDASGYWVPALKRGTATINPSAVQVVFKKTVTATIRAHPEGLVLIAGSSKATSAQATSIVGWSCGSATTRTSTPQVCTGTTPLVASIVFPTCWDGKNLDSSDHKSHVSYAVAGTCKAGTIPLVQIELRISYPRQSNVSGLTLASGSIYSMHADFMNGWKQRGFESKVARLN
ncbi:MAG: hypothetical protein RLY87_2480 [Chloroflexota bacterium]|jgi:hypothetical protein